MPAFAPGFGHSFSADHVQLLNAAREAAALGLTGGATPSAYSSGAATPAGTAGGQSQGAVAAGGANGAPPHYHAPGSTVCSLCVTDGSCDDMHLLAASSGSYSHAMHAALSSTAAAAASSAAAAAAAGNSSGTSTPLRGPRGTPSVYRPNGNSLSELHHLQLLHAQSGNPTLSTLLPLCPLGAASSQLAHAHAAGLANLNMSLSLGMGMPMGPLGVAHLGAAGLLERIGAYTREERARRVARYKDKKARRVWSKRVLYQVRKDFAVSRRRVGGRFIKKQNAGCPCADFCVPGCVNYREDQSEAAQLAAQQAAKEAQQQQQGGSKSTSRSGSRKK